MADSRAALKWQGWRVAARVPFGLSGDSWELAGAPAAIQMQEFAASWRQLDERQQSAALAAVLREVRFDPHGGTISVTLFDDAWERLRGK